MLQPGTHIGRYEIQRRLGRGGMGTVYVAHDPVLGRMVAIKVFLGDLDLPDASDRFVREARSAAALNHASIVTVHDFGDFSSQPYIVMEYVQGETLGEAIRRKAPVSTAVKVRWLEDLCAGLAYAHRGGVIHRDIKPPNLMIDRSGRLKILDFGIARMVGTLSSNATALIGTPGYMAPEQIVGGTIDHRSDLFSVGVVGYELLSYTEAFPGDTIVTITHRILSEDPVPLSQLAPDLPADLIAAVERALKKSAAERFADAEAFGAVLGAVRRQLEGSAGEETVARLPDRVTPPPSERERRSSARKAIEDSLAVTQLTPSPESRAVAREDLVRRRTAQIDSALDQARALLRDGDLDAALEACVQALTLDDAHPDALTVEQAIRAALAKRRAGVLVSEARQEIGTGALTVAQDLLEQARALDSNAPDLKRLERDLRLARVEQQQVRQRAESAAAALEAARRSLVGADPEAALAFARQALELDPTSTEARALEAAAVGRIDDETGAGAAGSSDDIAPTMVARPGPPGARVEDAPAETMIAKPAPKRPAPPPATRPAVAGRAQLLGALGGLVTKARAAVGARSRRELAVAGYAAGALVAMLAVGGALLTFSAPVPTGTLVIDAVPWATVTGIESSDGTPQPFQSPASTPLVVNLPAGTYRIRVEGPPPEAEPRAFTMQVDVGAVAAAPELRFKTLTPDEYFERYLAPLNPETAVDATTPPGVESATSERATP